MKQVTKPTLDRLLKQAHLRRVTKAYLKHVTKAHLRQVTKAHLRQVAIVDDQGLLQAVHLLHKAGVALLQGLHLSLKPFPLLGKECLQPVRARCDLGSTGMPNAAVCKPFAVKWYTLHADALTSEGASKISSHSTVCMHGNTAHTVSAFEDGMWLPGGRGTENGPIHKLSLK